MSAHNSIPPGLMPQNYQPQPGPQADAQINTDVAAPQMPPPPGIPAMHNYDPVAIAQVAAAGPGPIFPATPAPGVEVLKDGVSQGALPVTDIEIPDINEVAVRDFSQFDSKLKVINPDPQLEYRWVNSDPQRYARLYAEGWRPVRNRDRARSEVDGDTPELYAGTDQFGAGRRAILMARQKFFRDRRDASMRELIKQNQTSLDPKRYSGNNGTTDNESYQGALKMGVSLNG